MTAKTIAAVAASAVGRAHADLCDALTDLGADVSVRATREMAVGAAMSGPERVIYTITVVIDHPDRGVKP